MAHGAGEMAYHNSVCMRSPFYLSPQLTRYLPPSKTQAIDDTYRSTSKTTDSEAAEEGKKIVEELARLKYEVQHDRQLTYVAQ